jgi:hypothetical protein
MLSTLLQLYIRIYLRFYICIAFFYSYNHERLQHTSSPPLRVQLQPTIPYNQQDQLLDQEVSLLLNKGAIEGIQPTTPGFYNSMFVISEKTGDSRPVFNLKKKTQQLYSSPTFQNGSIAGSYQTNQTEQFEMFPEMFVISWVSV